MMSFGEVRFIRALWTDGIERSSAMANCWLGYAGARYADQVSAVCRHAAELPVSGWSSLPQRTVS